VPKKPEDRGGADRNFPRLFLSVHNLQPREGGGLTITFQKLIYKYPLNINLFETLPDNFILFFNIFQTNPPISIFWTPFFTNVLKLGGMHINLRDAQKAHP